MTVPVAAAVAQLLQPRWASCRKPAVVLQIDTAVSTDSADSVFNSYFGALLILLNLDLIVIATFFSTGM